MANRTEMDFQGGTLATPPPGQPGDVWSPEDSPRLRMNDEHEWVPDSLDLASRYGVCTSCGAARTVMVVADHTSAMGESTTQWGIVCSADRDHAQDMP